MTKKLIALLLVAVLLLTSGCTSLFKKEYLSVAEYTDEEHNESRQNAKEVSSYAELKNAINDMVKNHVEEERLRFIGYDGAIHNDLSQVFSEVKEETVLGSYSVSYMSYYEVGRLVTYYEATVYINYKRTEAEIAAITYVAGEPKLLSFLDETMTSLKRYAAIRMISADLNEAYLIAAVNRTFNANPASCVLAPEVTVTVHSSAGTDCIIEFEFNYGRTATVISAMRQELDQAIVDITSGILSSEPQAFALEAYNSLAMLVSYDPDGEIRKAAGGLVASLNGSVYGALVEGIADSRGLALAYSALCREAGVECFVVTGTLDKAEHSWNIIRLGENYYHVDVSADFTLGITGAFGRSDDQMLSGYWWNIEDYPECLSSLDVAEIYAPAK